ncbi:MAG: DNA gyrase inhibitor YacG [Pirellulales bacterium]
MTPASPHPASNFAKCPSCGKRFSVAESEAVPFCSARCRQIDLGRWLGEQHSVPLARHEEDEELAE